MFDPLFDHTSQMLVCLAAALGLMAFLWLISLRLKDVSFIDAFWAPCFAWIAWVAYLVAAPQTPRSFLILGLITLWAARLGGYLWRRWRLEGEEDRRYQAMRRKFPDFPIRSLLTVFTFQAVLAWVISMPLQLALFTDNTHPFGLLDYVGIACFGIGFFMEATADAQLTAFKKAPSNKGKVLDTGLWGWSRHPNYFGNALLWWGLFFICLTSYAALATIFAPLLMTYLIINISGVKLLERGLAKTRPHYADYIAQVSAFVPLPPKRERHK